MAIISAIISIGLIFFFIWGVFWIARNIGSSKSSSQRTKESVIEKGTDALAKDVIKNLDADKTTKDELQKKAAEYYKLNKGMQELRNSDVKGKEEALAKGKKRLEEIEKEFEKIAKKVSKKDKKTIKDITNTENLDTELERISKKEIDADARTLAHMEEELERLERDLGGSGNDSVKKRIRDRIKELKKAIDMQKQLLSGDQEKSDAINESIVNERRALAALSEEDRKSDKLAEGIKKLSRIEDNGQKMRHIEWLYYVVRDVTGNDRFIDGNLDRFMELHEKIDGLSREGEDYFEKIRRHAKEWEGKYMDPNRPAP